MRSWCISQSMLDSPADLCLELRINIKLYTKHSPFLIWYLLFRSSFVDIAKSACFTVVNYCASVQLGANGVRDRPGLGVKGSESTGVRCLAVTVPL